MQTVADWVVSFLTLLLGREDIASNVLAAIIFAILAGILTALKLFFVRDLPWKIVFYSTTWALRRHLNPHSVGGFYFAIYNSSIKIGSQKKKSSDKNPAVDETKVAECIYLHKHFFSQKTTGTLLRRVKRKNGSIDIEDNAYFGSMCAPRIAGCFSESSQVFCGYWLDPYHPRDVAGTLMLKRIDDNIAKKKRTVILSGEWQGFDKRKLPSVRGDVRKGSYVKTGGYWEFIYLGANVADFRRWKTDLHQLGDGKNNPQIFLDWTPK